MGGADTAGFMGFDGEAYEKRMKEKAEKVKAKAKEKTALEKLMEDAP